MRRLVATHVSIVMRRAAIWLGLWTAVGLAVATQWYLVESRLAAAPHGWWWQVRTHVPDWWLWALAALLTISLARRFPLDREHFGSHAFVHLGVSLHLALGLIVAGVAIQPAPFLPRFADALAMLYYRNVLVYWAIVAVVHAIDYHRAVEDRRIHQARLEARLAEARLQALTLQLQPHFLFNTLNAVAELMHENVAAADRMLSRLAELLRATLDAREHLEVTLQHELELAQRYLEIQRVRFGDRLVVRVDVPVEARDGRVPALLLLPLVENAVRHGIAARPGPGAIGIRAWRAGATLRLEVWDDGPGLRAPVAASGWGIGLANTRARLEQLYGHAHRLDLDPRDGGGLTVRVEIPFRLVA